MANLDYRKFLCPDNAHNRQQHVDLENAKQNGWQVTDAVKDAVDPNVMVITLADSGGGGGPAGASLSAAAPKGPMPRGPVVRLKKKSFALNARPDPIDFRDRMYEPTLVEVPVEWPLAQYLKAWGKTTPPILDQGQEGACTGFGLAAVAHFLLNRRKVYPDSTEVSPRMFYEMARRYDEWEGEDYSGSSARGAMKGWHKHGVCAKIRWLYKASSALGTLTPERASDALQRPLGAYFRVNHRELVAMHSALAEVGILYATSVVHEGWADVGKDGIIKRSPKQLGGHAFAIVGYDVKGLWVQNSWGPTWGRKGFAHVSYDDWLENGTDVWVARLGAPVFTGSLNAASRVESVLSGDVRRAQLQPHTIAIGNDGYLRETGEVGNSVQDVARVFQTGGDIEKQMKGWKQKRLLFYAHGGLTSERDALQRVSEYLPALLRNEIYPLAFVWKTDLWSTLGNMLKDVVARRRPEGVLDGAKEFMLDRLDDTLEIIARLPGKAIWHEMKENACLATDLGDGGARIVLDLLGDFLKRNPSTEVHIAAHSAGSIFLGRFLREFCRNGGKLASLNLWAPACTMDFFQHNFVPALQQGSVDRFGLYTLKDPAERDDHCANIYHKSLLYLVAHAFESKARVFAGDGTPILGMEKFILKDAQAFGVNPEVIQQTNPPAVQLELGKNAWWIRSPNNLPPGDPDSSTSRRHGDFDDDAATVQSTLSRILDAVPSSGGISFSGTASGQASRRRDLDRVTRRGNT